MTASKADWTALEWVAWGLSRLFHPFIITIPTLILAIYATESSWSEAIKWTAISVGTVIVPTFLFIAYNVLSGRYSDWSVSIREQRHGLYAVGGACLLLLLIILIVTNPPQILLICLYAAVLANLVGALVNRLTKVSVHSAAMAGSAVILLLVAKPVGIVLLVLMPIVGWSRMKLKHHSGTQVLLGWGIAAGSVLLLFTLMTSI